MGTAKDKFGLRLGSNVSRAMEMYEKGASHKSVFYLLGGKYTNALTSLSRKGHHWVKNEDGINFLLYNPKASRKIVPMEQLTRQHCEDYGLRPEMLNSIIQVYRIPASWRTTIPDGFEVIHTIYQKKMPFYYFRDSKSTTSLWPNFDYADYPYLNGAVYPMDYITKCGFMPQP